MQTSTTLHYLIAAATAMSALHGTPAQACILGIDLRVPSSIAPAGPLPLLLECGWSACPESAAFEVTDAEGRVVAGTLSEATPIDTPYFGVDNAPHVLEGKLYFWTPDEPLRLGQSYSIEDEAGQLFTVAGEFTVEDVTAITPTDADLDWFVGTRDLPVGDEVCCTVDFCFPVCFGAEGSRAVAQMGIASSWRHVRLYRIEGEPRWSTGVAVDWDDADEACVSLQVWEPRGEPSAPFEHCESLSESDAEAIRAAPVEDWKVGYCAPRPPMPPDPPSSYYCVDPEVCPLEFTPPQVRWCEERLAADTSPCEAESEIPDFRAGCEEIIEEQRVEAEVWCEDMPRGDDGCSATRRLPGLAWLSLVTFALAWRARRHRSACEQ